MAELILVADRVLIQPDEGEKLTASGLVLPASVADREKVKAGRVVKVGPGYLIPNPEYSEGEDWQQSRTAVRYLPLQAAPGDSAFFLSKEATELTYEGKTYLIIPHAAILALVRTTADDVLDRIHGLA
jgi:co-chaperonin GroES (HSP10)